MPQENKASAIAVQHVYLRLSGHVLTRCPRLQNQLHRGLLMELVSTQMHLTYLRRQLRNLTQQRRRHVVAVAQAWTLLQHVPMKAVVMFMLIGEPRWPIILVKRWQWRHVNRVVAMPTETNEAVLQQYGAHDRVQHMLHHLADVDRLQVDSFLIQSLIYEEIDNRHEICPMRIHVGLVTPACCMQGDMVMCVT